MPTPPRKIEQVPRQRAEELPLLEQILRKAIDKLKLARIYAEDGAPSDAAERLESARQQVADVLEELNTFRAPVPAAKPRNAGVPHTDPKES